MEILTVKEVASILRVSIWHVYELTHPRTKSGDVRENPNVNFGLVLFHMIHRLGGS
jgi:hypothetical protein